MSMSANASTKPSQIRNLKLFVADSGGRARLLEHELHRLFEHEIDSDYSLDVINVMERPELAEAANIALTPTLLLEEENNHRRLVGDVARRERLIWLIGTDDGAPRFPKATRMTRSLANLSPDGMVLADKEGRALAANTVGLRMLGLQGRQLSGSRLSLPVSVRGAHFLTLASGVPVELRVSDTTWQGRPAFLALLRDLSNADKPNTAAGQPDGMSSAATDAITAENKSLQSALEQATKAMGELSDVRDELERSNEELLSFSHRVSHDIKTPLRGMRFCAEVVLEDDGDKISSEGTEMLQQILTSTDRLTNLLDALLNYASVGGDDEPFVAHDLNTIVRWAITDLEPMLKEAGATCEVGPLPTVSGNAGQLYQVFQNLIGNAIKYRRGDVPLKIVFKDLAEQNGVEPPASMVEVVVEDNGTGFDNSQQSKIFAPFVRLVGESTVKGSGIGLATVQRIAERHKGSVRAEGVVGQGARFIVRLPVAAHIE